MARARRLCRWSNRTVNGVEILAHLADAGQVTCATHRAMDEQRRGTPAARGYGFQHNVLRRAWAQRVKAGGVACARCGLPIDPDEPWHLDHNDDRTGYRGPSHRDCNESAPKRSRA